MAKLVIFRSSNRFSSAGSFCRVDEGDQDRALLHRVDHVEGWRLDSQDDIGVGNQGLAIIHEADVLERAVRQLDGVARARLHVEFAAKLDQLGGDGWRQRHAPFMRAGFLQNGDIDVHLQLQSLSAAPSSVAPSFAEERPARGRDALRLLDRRARSAVLCFVSCPLALRLLGARVQLRLRLVLFHVPSCCTSLFGFHWPEFGVGVCADIPLTSPGRALPACVVCPWLVIKTKADRNAARTTIQIAVAS